MQTRPEQAGWYPDPSKRFESRFWDGASWTQAVMRGNEVEADPDPMIVPGQGGYTQPIVPAAPVIGPPPSPTDRLTSLPPQEAQSRVHQMLAMSGVIGLQGEPGRIRGMLETKGEPNMAVFIILLFIWILPGVIYWIRKSKTQRTPIDLLFLPNGAGTRIAIQARGPAMQHLATVLAPLPW